MANFITIITLLHHIHFLHQHHHHCYHCCCFLHCLYHGTITTKNNNTIIIMTTINAMATITMPLTLPSRPLPLTVSRPSAMPPLQSCLHHLHGFIQLCIYSGSNTSVPSISTHFHLN